MQFRTPVHKMLIFVIWICISNVIISSQDEIVEKHHADTSTVILTHVIFRHGDRTPDIEELYPKDPYLNFTYFPFGAGQLTNPGKKREYGIGEALRKRYDKFLGNYYYPRIVDAVSTNYNRTKMSLQLVLAGLFPPRDDEIWSKKFPNWQPVPYNYLPLSEDKILAGYTCENFIIQHNEVNSSPKVQDEYKQYQDTFNYISENTGLNITKFVDIYTLYFGLAAEEEWGFKLPRWTEKVWPETIMNLSVKEYYVSTATTNLKRMGSGYLIEKIIGDTQRKIDKENDKNGVKIYLYSAHEMNIAQLLILFDVKVERICTYGSYIFLEIHNVKNAYGVKIFHHDPFTNDTKLIKLQACEELCPWNKFQSLLEEYIPSDDPCDD